MRLQMKPRPCKQCLREGNCSGGGGGVRQWNSGFGGGVRQKNWNGVGGGGGRKQ